MRRIGLYGREWAKFPHGTLVPRSGIAIMLILVLSHGSSQGAFERLPAGARSAALCDALQVSPGELYALEANPSVLSGVKAPSVGCSYVPGLFGLAELRRLELAAAAPLGRGGAGGLIRSFGNDLYREISITLGYAFDAAERWSAGLGITAYNLTIAGYGRAWTLGIHAGARFRIAEGLLFGASIRNMNRPTLGRSREPIGAELLAGMQYAPVPSFRLMIGLSREERSVEAVSAGVEMEPAESVTLRAAAAASSYGLGAGVQAAGIRLDYGLVMHLELGMTHHFSITFELPLSPFSQ